jgi:hypothetical protein
MLLAKMPIFGFLINLPVWAGGKCLLRGLNPQKTWEISQNGIPVALDGVLNLPCFLKKEGLMNKRIVAFSILLLMMCAMAASVFADDAKYEYEYKVVVTYVINKIPTTKTYYVWASSNSEAMDLAERTCKWDIGNSGKVTSCGIPVATGKSRPR